MAALDSIGLIAAACCVLMTTFTVESFSPTHFFGSSHPLMDRQRNPRKLSTTTAPLLMFEEYMSEDYNPRQKRDENNNDDDEISYYGMGGVDLSQKWVELVAGGHIAATTELSDDVNNNNNNNERLLVRYGVRLEEEGGLSSQQREGERQRRLLEFAQILPNQDEQNADSELRDHIMSINATLTEMQLQKSGMAIDCIYDGPYAVQLQLVRTLRPPRSKEMTRNTNNNNKNAADEKVSCQPPPYDSSKDSFLVGPLRLFGHAGEFHGEGEPRERAAQILVPRGSAGDDYNLDSPSSNKGGVPWDVFHNISPVDPRGHFLLLPDISNKKQWRDQSLNSHDCHDLTYLASTIQPPGSMVLSFNSVSAGASQNHIHAHAWLNPPPPLLYRKDPTAEYDSVYAVTKVASLASLELAHGVTASLLKYPCTCVKLSATLHEEENEKGESSSNTLKEMGHTLSKVIGVAQTMQIPHNVVWTNNHGQQQHATNIDTYIFFRRAETLDVAGNTFRLGASEMMGVFHSSSKDELFNVKKYRGLSCYGAANILSDISYEPHQHVWAEVCNALGKKTNRRLMALRRAELYKKETTKSGSNSEEVISTQQRYVRTGVPYDLDDD